MCKYNLVSASYSRCVKDVTQPGQLSWQYWSEPVPPTQAPLFRAAQPLEQLNITQDQTEYLFYSATLDNIAPGSVLTLEGRCANSY